MAFKYNLIDEPWIPALDTGGGLRYVGIRDLLVNSHNYDQLAASLPQSNAALFKLLLAILFRIFGPIDPKSWSSIWEQKAFDSTKIEAYLQTWHQRFDLFDPVRPFFQGQNSDVKVKPVNLLLFNTGGGNPETLFDHSVDDAPLRLSPDQAAVALVTAQSFSLAGLCNPHLNLVYTDAPCSRAAVFLLQGKNLFETLMLNLVRYNRQTPIPWRERQDLPAWERDDPYKERTLPDGYVDYLTWQNRRVMLFPELVEGKVMVTQVSMAPGLVLSAEQRNPMHHYRIDPDVKPDKPAYRVLRFVENRALWRDSSALLGSEDHKAERPACLNWAEELKFNHLLPKRKLDIAAYGMSTEPGKSKVFFYRAETFKFSDELLDHPELVGYLNQALDRAEQVRKKLWVAVNTMAGLLTSPDSDQKNGHKPDPKTVAQLLAHWNAEGFFWQALELPFYQFLDDLTEHPQAAYDQWIQDLKKTAKSTFEKTAAMAGNNTASLKAAAKGELSLFFGLKNELEDNSKEEIKNA